MATTPPILRLTTEAGDSCDDPSEDALFEYMGDLEETDTNTWLVVERLGGDDAGDQMRLMFDAQLVCFRRRGPAGLHGPDESGLSVQGRA